MFLKGIKKNRSCVQVRRKMAAFRDDERTINLLVFSGQRWLWFLFYFFIFLFFFGSVVSKMWLLCAKNYGWIHTASVKSPLWYVLVIYVATQVVVLKILYTHINQCISSLIISLSDYFTARDICNFSTRCE